MKKVIATLLTAFMLFSVPALGEGIDVSVMNLEELILLRESIDSEIQTRFGFSDETIGSGYYTVGEDITAGKYELICLSADIETSGSGMTRNRCNLVITSDDTDKAEVLFEYYEISVGQQMMIKLDEGNVLVLARGNFMIQPYSHSWEP